MTRPYPLEIFDVPDRARPGPGASFGPGNSAPGAAATRPASAEDTPAPPDMEEERLAAFEKGYRAGWDDASAAHSEEQGRIAADLARNLQDLSFTYHEAHAAMQRETADLLRSMLDRVLPSAMHAALAETILARVGDALGAGATPVEIVVAPGNVARVEALVADRPAPPLRLRAEPSLGDGQAFLRLGSAEERVDYDGLMAELAAMVDRYCDEVAAVAPRQEVAHG